MLYSPFEEMKQCSICKTELPLSEFYRNRSARDGFEARCKYCSTSRVTTRRTSGRSGYRFNKHDYDRKRVAQNNGCAICKKVSKLDWDHCHLSLEGRGLLCRSCNIGLGMFKDNTEFLKTAIQYLEQHK